MVKLAVRYDKNLKSNVFVVRDDESYVSSTKTIIILTDPIIEQQYGGRMYGVDVTINVLREIGTSKVVLYDGDDVLKTWDWAGVPISEHCDFYVGTAHRLKAVFMGNKNCLRSQSKSVEVFLPHPETNTHISYVGNSIITTETSFTFELVDDEGHDVDSGTLTVSYNDSTNNDIKEVEVSYGSATVDFTNVLSQLSKGLINLSVVYTGTGQYSDTSLDVSISKYYDVSLTGYMDYAGANGTDTRRVIGEDYTLVGSVVDFIGNPYPVQSPVTFYASDGNDWYSLYTGQVGSDGKLVFNIDGESEEGMMYFSDFSFGINPPSEEFNKIITPPIITVLDIFVTTVRPQETGTGIKAYLANVSSVGVPADTSLVNLPVHITNSGLGINDVRLTAPNTVYFSYAPYMYKTGFNLDIRCGEVTKTQYVPYYLTYSSGSSLYGRPLGTKDAFIDKDGSVGVRYTAVPTSLDYGAIYAEIPEDMVKSKHKFSFKVLNTSDNYFFYGLTGNNGITLPSGIPEDHWLGVGDTAEYIYDYEAGTITCTAQGRVRFTETIDRSTKFYPAIIKINGQGTVILGNVLHEVLP